MFKSLWVGGLKSDGSNMTVDPQRFEMSKKGHVFQLAKTLYIRLKDMIFNHRVAKEEVLVGPSLEN